MRIISGLIKKKKKIPRVLKGFSIDIPKRIVKYTWDLPPNWIDKLKRWLYKG